jgi:hypothetical protein
MPSLEKKNKKKKQKHLAKIGKTRQTAMCKLLHLRCFSNY